MITLKNAMYAYSLTELPQVREQYVQNILDCYGRSPDEVKQAGMVWYPQADDQVSALAGIYKWPVRMAQAAAALLTQMVRWEETLKSLENLMAGVPLPEIGHPLHRQLAPKVAGILNDTDNAHKYLGAAFKIPAFFASMVARGESLIVCIDRWAARVALNFRIDAIQGKALYLFLQDCYQKAAELLGIWPAQLQAITWVQKRIEWKGEPKGIFQAPRVTV